MNQLTPMQTFCLEYFKQSMVYPAFGMAIVEHESGFYTWAEATDPRDLARGGSRGLTQLSLTTAKALDPLVQADDLFFPSVNLGLFLKLYQANLKRLPHGLIPGTEAWVKGCAMEHNTGRFLNHPNQEVRAYCDAVWALYRKWADERNW